jgi:hypothetical protein
MPSSARDLPGSFRLLLDSQDNCFFRHHEGTVDKAFGEIESAPLFQVLAQDFKYLFEGGVLDPALEAAMTGLVRRIPLGQIRPLCPGPQDPQNAIQHLTAAAPGASTSVRAPWQLANERLYNVPLFIR